MNTVILGNVGVVSKKLFKSDGKKPFMVLRVVSTEQNDQKTYITVHVYDKLAEIVDKYVVPGSKVNINGKLKTNPRTTKSGDKIDELVVNANTIEFLSSPKKKGDGEATTENTAAPTETAPATSEAPVTAATEEAPPAAAYSAPADDEDEDLPF